MERRDFVRLAGLGLAAGASAAEVPLEAVRAAPTRKALMKVGTQHGDSDDILRVMASSWCSRNIFATAFAAGESGAASASGSGST